MASKRPVSDEEISQANSLLKAFDEAMSGKTLLSNPEPVLVWAAWNASHAAHSHNQTYRDQEFLRIAWKHLLAEGKETAASDNLAHFLAGNGTPKTFSLAKLFHDDQGFTKAFNAAVGQQIYTAEQACRQLGSLSEKSLDAFLRSNLRSFDKGFHNLDDLRKDYGPLNFRYDGHVDILQGSFKNQSWKNTTGGLTVFWLYAGKTGTSGYKQYRVVAWCIKQYKWHPRESTRFTQVLHIAAENAKAPQVDTSYKGVSQGLYAAPIPLSGPTQGDIKLGSHTIGHWKDTDMTRQTVYNPAKEFKLVFQPVERIVPVYVKSAIGSATATTS